jgi:hypothetical protein
VIIHDNVFNIGLLQYYYDPHPRQLGLLPTELRSVVKIEYSILDAIEVCGLLNETLI